MADFQVGFNVTVCIGSQSVPIVSEIVHSTDASTGVENGFVFKLNRPPFAAPPLIYLGDLVSFIEDKLGAGAGALAVNENMSFLTSVIPSLSKDKFNSRNQTVLAVNEFTINSTSQQSLFSFNLDVTSTNPTGSGGIVSLPADIAQWLCIENLSISLSSVAQ